jgi:hypothetical protein
MVQKSVEGSEGGASDVATGLVGESHIQEGVQVIQGVHHRPVCNTYNPSTLF